MDNRFSRDLLRIKSLLVMLPSIFLAFISIYSIFLYITFDAKNLDFGTNTSKIYDRNGTYLWELSKDNAVKNTKISINDVPLQCVEAIVAVEDKNFWVNIGVDFNGLARLGISLVTRGSAGGGSTISQQIIKVASQNFTNRNPIDKLTEIVSAVALTKQYTKEEILELYVNNVFFGNLNYGIESASQDYFGKPAKEMTLSECAYMMGLPQNPGIFNPYANVDLGISRRKTVLDAMLKESYINEAQYTEAINTELNFALTDTEVRAPHYIQFIQDNLKNAIFINPNIQNFTNISPNEESYKITTFYDYELHKKVLDLSNSFVKANLGKNVNNAAIVILDNNNEVVNMTGSIDFFDDSIDGKFNSSLGSRQPGSALIPFIYSLQLQEGGDLSEKYNSSDLALKVTRSTGVEDLTIQGDGPLEMALRDAIISSSKIPAIRIVNSYGPAELENSLAKFEVQSPGKKGRCNEIPILEGCEITLLDLTYLYSNFKNKGFAKPIQLIKDITLADESIQFSFTAEESNENLNIKAVSDLIKSNDQITLINGDVVNNKDTFSVGYSERYTVGVWVGNTKGDPLVGASSENLTKPLLNEIFKLLE
jgi:membrane peptidoglycan carboxypeptidase